MEEDLMKEMTELFCDFFAVPKSVVIEKFSETYEKQILRLNFQQTMLHYVTKLGLTAEDVMNDYNKISECLK